MDMVTTVLAGLIVGLILWLMKSIAGEHLAKKEKTDIEKEYSSLKKEYSEKEKEITKLKAKIAGYSHKPSLTYNNAYNVYVDETNIMYCPTCYTDKGKANHLHELHSKSGWNCPVCNTKINNPNYTPSSPE